MLFTRQVAAVYGFGFFVLAALNLTRRQSQPQCASPLPYAPLTNEDVDSPILTNALSRIHRIIDEAANASDTASLSVAIVQDQSVLLTYGNATSYHSIGSLTKLFVSLLMMLMRDAGKLSLEDPLTKYIPKYRIRDPYLGRDADPPTLRMLAAHTSGLLRDAPYSKNYSEADMLAYLATVNLLRPPWSSTPAYSNVGFALLGHALEAVCGGKWGECLKTQVWDRLNMSETGAVATRDQLSNFSPNPYGEEAMLFDIGYGNPSGSMYSTLTDLVKFVKAFNRNDLGLKPYSIDEWTHPQITLLNESKAFGMGLELYKLDNITGWVVTKNGAVLGQTSIIAFYRPLKIGIVALCSGETSCTNIGLALLKELHPAVRRQIASGHTQAKYTGVYAGSANHCSWRPGILNCSATLNIYLHPASDSLLANYSISYTNVSIQNQPAWLIPDQSDKDIGRFFLVDIAQECVGNISSLGLIATPKGVPADLLRFEAAADGQRVVWEAFEISMKKLQ
ncbi:uncharacterized protein VTP21DRAFT_1028 [Calcarisporiella thermophila]|uniref:uncharacterized protein n=1 Tax=Calcarisporiella thermophila TaxID=911321 RepID=UPI003741EFC2